MIHFLVIFVAQSLACHYSCLTCSGTTEFDCLTCSEGATINGQCNCNLGVFQNGICQSQCNQGYYQQLDQCLQCGEGCKNCQNNICLECLQNYKLENSEFCSPHCAPGFYFLANNCLSLLLSVQVSNVVYEAFNDDVNQCEIEASLFTFDSILSGSLCQYYNNYVIFGNDRIWNKRQGSVYLANLPQHKFVRIYLKAFFINNWSNGDFLQIYIDDEKVFKYQFTGQVKEKYTQLDIKTNSSHIKSDLTLTLKVPNLKEAYLGINNLQIITDICGCQSCSDSVCQISLPWNNNSQCNQNQLLVDQSCIDCNLLQNRLSNCECQNGYYLNESTNDCQQCNYQCQECKYQANYCISCSINRIGPFICGCIDGYYENDQGQCIACSEQCLTCQFQANNCIACSNSLYIAPKCYCEFSITPNIESCLKCIKQEAQVELSSSFNHIIISFEDNFYLFSQKCELIFFDDSLKMFGENPICKISNNSIKVLLGRSFNYTKSSPLLINQTNIKVNNCLSPLQSIQLFYRIPEQSDSFFFLNYNFIYLTKKTSKTIFLQTNLEYIFNLKWTILHYKVQDQNVSDLVQLWNSQQDRQFNIQGNQFYKDNVLNLSLSFCDFTLHCSIQNLDIIIQVEALDRPNLQILVQSPPIYENQKLLIEVLFENKQKIQLNQSTSNSQALNFNSTVFGKNLNIQYENQTLFENELFLITIEDNQLVQGELYTFQFLGLMDNYTYQDQINFFIQPSPLYLKIQGGSKYVSFSNQHIVSLTMNNFDLTQTNNIFSQIIWECKTISTNQECVNRKNEQLIGTNNLTQLIIEKFSFSPYTVAEIAVSAILNNSLYQDKISYYFVEENIPQLKIITNNKVQNQVNNEYDKIQFKLEIEFPNLQIDDCIYSGSIIYDYEIQAYIQLFYPEFRIQLSDNFKIKNNENLVYKFSVLIPQFIMPSISQISLQFNLSPQECQITVSELKYFPRLYQLSIDSCKENDLPLQFRFSIFIKSNSNKNKTQIYLNNQFDYKNSIVTILINMISSPQNITINVDVLDRYLGLASFQTNFQLEQQLFTDKDFVSLKQYFNEEQFLLQTNYLISYLYINNLLYYSQIFQGILLNFSLSNLSQINIKLQLISQYFRFNSYQITDKKLQSYLDEQFDQAETQINQINKLDNGFQYFNQFKIQEQIKSFLDLIDSYIISINEERNLNFRLLDENNQNQSSKISLKQNFDKIGSLMLKTQFPNENKQQLFLQTFSLGFQKVTDKYLNKSKIQMNIAKNTYLSLFELELNSTNLTTGLSLPKLQSDQFPIQYYNILPQNESQISNLDNGYIQYNFQIQQDENEDEDHEYACMVNIDENWQANVCDNIKEQNQVICKCQRTEMTSITQVLQNFKSNLMYIFTERNLKKISKVNYFQVMFFYMQILLTIFYIWFLFYGKKLDNIEYNKNNMTQQTRVYPSEKLPDLKKNLTLEMIENIPEVQVGNFGNKETINSQTINSPKETHRILKETVTTNEKPMSEISSPKSQLNVQEKQERRTNYFFNERHKNQSIITQMDTINQISDKNIEKSERTFFFLFSKFYKHYHKIIALYYKNDEKQSRPLRGTLIYLSLLGQMSFINWFGEVYDIITLILLSILSYFFALIYKKVICSLLSSQIIILQIFGQFIASLSAIFFIFVTISTIPLYQSNFSCNLWAISFLVSVLIDLSVYTTLQILLMFLVLIRFRQNTIFQKIIKRILDPVCFTIIFAVS